MIAAYVDASVVVAILLGEPEAAVPREILARHPPLLAADLLTAEVLSTASRESIAHAPTTAAVAMIRMIMPSRSLATESREALKVGLLRGGDLWHVACALYVAGPARHQLAFVTRDGSQRAVAHRLGFATP